MDKEYEILKAALQLFVKEGFHGTPTSRIAREAGVATGTLFHYYKTKDDLVIALYADIKEKMARVLETAVVWKKDFFDTFRSVHLNMLNWAMDHPTEFRFLEQFQTSPFLAFISAEEIKKQTAPHIALLEAAIEAGAIKASPPYLLYAMITSQVFAVYHYIQQSNLSSHESRQIIDESFEMIWKMLQ